MKIKILIITALFILFACQTATVRAESAETRITAGEDWSWESGAHNIFEGEINLSEFSGTELTVIMSSDLPYGSEEYESCKPVFVSVNDSRITMMKQNDTIRCTPSADDPAVRFSARLTLPDKQRVYGIVFQFTVSDENSRVLKTIRAELNGGENASGSVFYISEDIRRITICIGIAAAAVWAAVLFRTVYTNRKKKTGV